MLKLPEGADLGKAVSDAMEAIENENPELRGILPRDYSKVTNILGDVDRNEDGNVH